MIELLNEIAASISHNRTRIYLTGFAVGWGIFLLIIMLGAGNGIVNGITNGFIGTNNNIITITPGKTMLPAQGKQKDSRIDFYLTDCDKLEQRFPDIISKTMPQVKTTVRINYINDHTSVPISGFQTDYLVFMNRYISAGRDLDLTDISEERKVCVMSAPLAKRLFRDEPAVGKRINVLGNSFLVVGVATSNRRNDEEKCLYAPLSTVRTLFCHDNTLSDISIIAEGLNTIEANETFIKSLRSYFADTKGFSPKDEKAVKITGDFEYFLQIRNVLAALRAFIWIIGLATLCIGVVGISNIM